MRSVLFTLVALAASVATAQSYQIDTAASVIEWKAGKKTGSFHNGQIKVKGGTVEVDAKGEVKALQVNVDMKTISNEDLKDSPEYQKKLVEHLSSDDFFKVDKFPEASFKLTSIKAVTGVKNKYSLKGDLTIIGVTKTIEFPAEILSEKDKLVGSAVIKIERLNWGLQYGSGSIFKTLTADKIINDSFDLKLKFTAKK
ncbi:MAG: YceI family protein [Bdellovibrionia bacterium]